MLFISWNHYIPPQQRKDYKKTGITINGFGEELRSKNKDIKKSDNPNELLLKKDKNISVKKKNNVTFKDINTYNSKVILFTIPTL